MTEERREEQVTEVQETEVQEEQSTREIPGIGEVGKEMAEMRSRLAASEETTRKLQEQLKGSEGHSQVIEGLKQALGAKSPEEQERERAEAEFYSLLVKNPREAIKQEFNRLRQQDHQRAMSEKMKVDFQAFEKVYPEHKEFEEDMKAELIQNPSWFGKPRFLEKLLLTIVMDKKPELVDTVIAKMKGASPQIEGREPFMFESGSQTAHGDQVETGEQLITRLAGAGRPKTFFD